MNVHYIYNVVLLIQNGQIQFRENLEDIFPRLSVYDIMNLIN